MGKHLHLHRPSSMTSLYSVTSSHSYSPPHQPKDLPSLLIPANPALLDTSPKGGILINKRRPSDAGPIEIIAPSPVIEIHAPLTPGASSPDPSPTQRIRFAPLPDPRRPSSGEKDEGEAQDEEGFAEVASSGDPLYDEHAIEDDDEDDEDESRKGWKGMSMGSWKGTKKLLKPLRSPSATSALGLESKEDGGVSFGAPLKKSISTGGINNSGESERKRSFLSTSPATGSLLSARRPSNIPSSPGSASSSHRRNSSLNDSVLGSSPRPVKMLNGRVYGQRRQSDATTKRTEPEFNEWGGKDGGAMGSNSRRTDDDDGSGMEWVKKRREERERRKSEAATAEPMQSSTSAQSEPSSPLPVTPPPPIIQVSEVDSKGGLYPVESRPEEKIRDHEMETHQHEVRQVKAGVEDAEDEDEDNEEEGDEDEEEEDDEDDEEDDFELGPSAAGTGFRFTSSAAGVEVVSRHK